MMGGWGVEIALYLYLCLPLSKKIDQGRHFMCKGNESL